MSKAACSLERPLSVAVKAAGNGRECVESRVGRRGGAVCDRPGASVAFFAQESRCSGDGQSGSISSRGQVLPFDLLQDRKGKRQDLTPYRSMHPGNERARRR